MPGDIVAAAAQLVAAIAAAAPAARQVSHPPHYDMEINGSGLDTQQLRDAIRAEMTMADASSGSRSTALKA